MLGHGCSFLDADLSMRIAATTSELATEIRRTPAELLIASRFGFPEETSRP
jgi:hypothetical protein